ncbi:4Fe-4S ferredoxin iron-sulfur binding domain protein [Denitrovibrio acetiphilus DSM 12809]|uniref:4Fe-4S ferredoxin iron-sulfur binding domain protein n=2 Tax=Denitrovibrio TaxID=117999 RepID=D4H2E3_DENA2|nr:4Fe-4S ferredoxin iron-sulfur binding domain protein [Denitrovibrio acetiphilus DSM 12809]
MSKQYGFYIDTKHCTGCKACFVACKDRQNLNSGEKYRKVYEFSGGTWNKEDANAYSQSVYAFYVSMACNQCDDPACLNICPANAYTKRESDGIVVYDAEKCISCFGCQQVCPYTAPVYDYEAGHMKKCIMCSDETGVDGVPNPACVKACPSRALDFGEMEELKEKYGSLNTIASFINTTDPNVVYEPHKDASSGTTIVNKEEVF